MEVEDWDDCTEETMEWEDCAEVLSWSSSGAVSGEVHPLVAASVGDPPGAAPVCVRARARALQVDMSSTCVAMRAQRAEAVCGADQCCGEGLVTRMCAGRHSHAHGDVQVCVAARRARGSHDDG